MPAFLQKLMQANPDRICTALDTSVHNLCDFSSPKLRRWIPLVWRLFIAYRLLVLPLPAQFSQICSAQVLLKKLSRPQHRLSSRRRLQPAKHRLFGDQYMMNEQQLWLWFQSSQPQGAPKGSVVIVHGFDEHSGRYAHVTRALNAAGFAGGRYHVPPAKYGCSCVVCSVPV